MMAFAATNPATLRRWAISAAVVVLVHGAIVAAVVTWRKATVPAEPPSPIVIELAPMPAAPTTQQATLPPAPEQGPVQHLARQDTGESRTKGRGEDRSERRGKRGAKPIGRISARDGT